jgi:hypothetical protein
VLWRPRQKSTLNRKKEKKAVRTTPENGYESQRRAAALNVLLGQIGLSEGKETEWWNFHAYDELGGRTPTQAWLAGDEKAVEQLVRNWYAETERVLEERRRDQNFMAMLGGKIAALRSKSGLRSAS